MIDINVVIVVVVVVQPDELQLDCTSSTPLSEEQVRSLCGGRLDAMYTACVIIIHGCDRCGEMELTRAKATEQLLEAGFNKGIGYRPSEGIRGAK